MITPRLRNVLRTSLIHGQFRDQYHGRVLHLSYASSSPPMIELLTCKVYISEGRDKNLLREIEHDCSLHGGDPAPLVQKFCDEPYNRTGYTITGSQKLLSPVVLGLIEATLKRLNLQTHEASHPRLGVVDHVSVHPLGPGSTLAGAAAMARELGRAAGETHALPIFLYGAAHPEGRALRDVRRELGYFRGARAGVWQGSVGTDGGALLADFGPQMPDPRLGIIAIGACPWVTNFNVPIRGVSLDTGRRIARLLSERGGGLPSVEVLALPHQENAVEIACNLLDQKRTSAQAILSKIFELAEIEGLHSSAVGVGYQTGQGEEELLASARAWYNMIDNA